MCNPREVEMRGEGSKTGKGEHKWDVFLSWLLLYKEHRLVSSWKSLHGLPVFLDSVTWPLQSCQRSQSLCWSIQTGDQTQGFLLGSFLMGSSLDHEVGEWPCFKTAGWVSATKKPTRPCGRSDPPAVVHELV